MTMSFESLATELIAGFVQTLSNINNITDMLNAIAFKIAILISL